MIVELRASQALWRALLVLHVASCVLLLFFYPPSWPRHALLLALMVHLPFALRAARALPVTRLEVDAAQRWHVLFCDGRHDDAQLLGAPWVSPYFTTLNLVCADGRKLQVVLLADMVDGDAFRRLRVRLRRVEAAA